MYVCLDFLIFSGRKLNKIYLLKENLLFYQQYFICIGVESIDFVSPERAIYFSRVQTMILF